MLFWFLFLSLVGLAISAVEVKVPHCTRVWPGTYHHLSRTTVRARLEISETLCFVVPYNDAMKTQFGLLGHHDNRKSILIAFSHESTKQEYTINRKPYIFSIPQLSAHCTCDCHGTNDNCNPKFKGGECTRYSSHDGVCVRTYSHGEAGDGCPEDTTAPSEVCCEVLLKPTHLQYKVISLNGFVTTYTLRYHIFDHTYATDNRHLPLIAHGRVFGSAVTARENIVFPFMRTVTKPHLARILSRGSLIIPATEGDTEPRTMENVKIGDYGQGDLSEVGWFQMRHAGGWAVPAGHAKINKALMLVSKNCKSQQYAFDLMAWHYRVGEVDVNETLGIPISQYFFNIKSSKYVESSHPVLFIEPIRHELDLAIHIDGITKVNYVNHTSSVTDFGGEIRIDQFGNRYVFIAIEGATGTVYFEIQGTESQSKVLFAEYIASTEPRSVKKLKRVFTTLIDSDRYICVWPDGGEAHKKCRLFRLNREPLREVEFKEHGYVPGQTSCPGCNEFKSKTFLNWLNPVRWFSDGVQGFTQSLAVTTDIAIAVLIAILLVCVCRKCIWPLVCSMPKVKK